MKVRWQYTMRPTLPPPRRDVAAMVCSLLVMLVSASEVVVRNCKHLIE